MILPVRSGAIERSTRARSADHRRILIRDRAEHRTLRRVRAILEYIAEKPSSSRYNDPELERLDDLIGEADRLVRTL